ncbi:MAG: RIP metalloprotease [Acidimicrobiia bacterium]|nr:RIP metalloprotease [Acidimicrobiia bacterium]
MTGALIVIIGIIAMVMIHEAGHFVAAKAFGMKATEFFFGFGPKLWSTQRGETEYGIKAIPLGGYVRIIGMNPFEEVTAEEEERTYRRAKFWQKAVVVLAGVGSNFAVAFVILYFVAAVIGEPDTDAPLPIVAGVVVETAQGQQTAASAAGLREGDLFVEVNGTNIDDWDQLVDILHAAPNEEVDLVIERDGKTLELVTTLTSRFNADSGQNEGFLGVSPQYVVLRDNPAAALVTAGDQMGVLVAESTKGMWTLVSGIGGLVSGVISGEDVGENQARPLSPIGIARLGAESEAVGLDLTLTIVAWFNVFVGLLNVLPIYPLDGGHFSVALYEKVVGRRADVRKLAPIAAAVVIFLVLLGVLGIYLDIVDPLNLS